MLSQKKVREIFIDACRKINAPKDLTTYRTCPADLGYSHYKIDKDGYHYIVTERGEEIEHKVTKDSDEFLFWMLDSVIFKMGSEYELENRVEGQDSRRISFSKRMELFEKLNNPTWTEMFKKKIEGTLQRYPFNDDLWQKSMLRGNNPCIDIKDYHDILNMEEKI